VVERVADLIRTKLDLYVAVEAWALAEHTHFGNNGCKACRRFKELQTVANRYRRLMRKANV
jgi:hypothetical protein